MRVRGLPDWKGGAGTMTLAIHVAVLAQESRKRVVRVDLDPQRSGAGWRRAREAETQEFVATELDKLLGILDAAPTDGAALVVLCTLPSASADAVQVATSAVVFVIPTRPSILDLRAILETLNLMNGSRKAHVVLNVCHAPRGATEASAATDARKAPPAFREPVAGRLAGVPSFPMPLLAACIGGLAATEAELSGKAAHEMRAVWRYVEKELAREKA